MSAVATLADEAPHQADAPGEPKCRLFLSYSRKDSEFVDRLATRLRERGLSPLIDRGEIGAFEDWWDRIKSLIIRSDALVVIISSNSMRSRVCLEEIAFAEGLKKRFAPVMLSQPDSEIPEALSGLQHITFENDADFECACDALVAGVQTDITWVRKHTELTEAARGWEAAGRHSGMLLRNPLLRDMQKWREQRPGGAPAITELQDAFLVASRKGARRRLVFRSTAIASGLVASTLVLGNIGIVVAIVQSQSIRESLLRGVGNSLRSSLKLSERLPASVAEMRRLENELEQKPGSAETEETLLRVYEEAINNYYQAEDRFTAVEVRKKQFNLAQTRYARKTDASSVNRLLVVTVRYADAKGVVKPGDHKTMDDFAIQLFEYALRSGFDTPESDQEIVRSYARRSMDRLSEPSKAVSLDLAQRGIAASNRALGRKNQIISDARVSSMSEPQKSRTEALIEGNLRAQNGVALCAMGLAQKADGKIDTALGNLVAAKAELEPLAGTEFKQFSERWLLAVNGALDEIKATKK